MLTRSLMFATKFRGSSFPRKKERALDRSSCTIGRTSGSHTRTLDRDRWRSRIERSDSRVVLANRSRERAIENSRKVARYLILTNVSLSGNLATMMSSLIKEICRMKGSRLSNPRFAFRSSRSQVHVLRAFDVGLRPATRLFALSSSSNGTCRRLVNWIIAGNTITSLLLLTRERLSSPRRDRGNRRFLNRVFTCVHLGECERASLDLAGEEIFT